MSNFLPIITHLEKHDKKSDDSVRNTAIITYLELFWSFTKSKAIMQ